MKISTWESLLIAYAQKPHFYAQSGVSLRSSELMLGRRFPQLPYFAPAISGSPDYKDCMIAKTRLTLRWLLMRSVRKANVQAYI